MSVGSAERLLAVLGAFSEERLEWTPEELMAELGYSRPTLYRYLKVLRESGLLISLPGGGLTLGPRVVELDFLMRRSDPLLAQGPAVLEALCARHPGTALLVRWYGGKLLCIDSRCSVPKPRSSYPRGRPMPLARGAIARAILAFLPRRRQVALIRASLDDHAATGLGDGVEAVVASLRRVRRDGVATAFGEVTPGVVGVAAPILDAERSPLAALCLTLAETDIERERIPEIAAEVRREAGALSVALSGGRAPVPCRAPASARDLAPADEGAPRC